MDVRTTDFSAARTAMERYVDQEIIPGVSWAVLRGHEVVDQQCVGFADREAKAALRPDHIFRAFSNTKIFVTSSIMLLVEEGRIGLDDPVEKFLPQLGNRKVLKQGAASLADVEPAKSPITIRQLLTHTSGLVAVNEPGPADYPFMKNQIAVGVVGAMGYRNMNYGLCRILISTIDAPFLFDLLPTVDDNYWDLTTIRYYQRYVQENVFDPAGVTSTFAMAPDQALAYEFPVNARGKDAGDLSTMSGAVGWRLSVDDLLAVMASFRRLGTMVDPARAQIMLDRGFGIDQVRRTPLGLVYAKGGFWSFEKGTFVQQTNAIFLPKSMELAILANSPLCTPDTGFMDRVLDAIERNIHLRLATLTVTAVAAFALAGLVRHVRAPRRP